MTKKQLLSMQKGVMRKLLAAISMLLVSSLMLGMSTYAWVVLSVAPEVREISTVAGANQYLEIALQSSVDGERSPISSGAGTSSAVQDVTRANLTWGALVDLTNNYGLERVMLLPSRLNIEPSTGNVSSGSYLTVPRYGSDGRIDSLLPVSHTSYDSRTFSFSSNTERGVTILGFQNELEAEARVVTKNRQQILDNARTKVYSSRAVLRTEIQNAISRNSLAIFGLMGYAANIDPPLITERQAETAVKDVVQAMDSVVGNAEESVRWALLAEACADTDSFNETDPESMEKLGEIYSKYLTMPMISDNPEAISVAGVAQRYGYEQIAAATNTLISCQSSITTAKAFLKNNNWAAAGLGLIAPSNTRILAGYSEPGSILNSGNPSPLQAYTWTGISYDVATLVYPMFMRGAAPKTEDWIYTLDAGQNLFSAMASILGDYQGDITVWVNTANGHLEESAFDGGTRLNYHIRATSGTVWNDWVDTPDMDSFDVDHPRIGTLAYVSKELAGVAAPGNISFDIVISQVDAYGYAIDLSFRTNKNGTLNLQSTPYDRVLGISNSEAEDNGYDSSTAGLGSTFSFDISYGLNEEQVEQLLSNMYIVFMNTNGKSIYAVAHTTDYAFDGLTVTGQLALFDYEIVNGQLTVSDDLSSSNAILPMIAGTEYDVTVLVYLNGDSTTSGMTSPSEGLSLQGTLNLQFSHSERLAAMPYRDFYIPEEAEPAP